MRAQPPAAARCGRLPLCDGPTGTGVAAGHTSRHPAPGHEPLATARPAAPSPGHRAPGTPAVRAARLPGVRREISPPLRAPLLTRLSLLPG
ncbi:hypothetical protein ACIBK8_30265 [Streptomyces sp. NPDC050161]|uniref:hypothetical protein n=1 Tax=Streptomyces sp. NPDC050161 TaxID=3365604 RepID=UPI0037B5CBA9